MSKPVILSVERWREIREDLHRQYPPSTFMRDNMKAKLGFTVREHKAWVVNKNYNKEWNDWKQRQGNKSTLLDWEPEQGHTELQIHLDFYDDKKKTFFLIKYGG